MNPARLVRDPKQLRSLASLRDVFGDGSFYTCEYTADYHLEEALALGATDLPSLIGGLGKLLLGGGKAGPGSFGAGCSAFACRNAEGHVLVGRNYDFRHDMALLQMKTVSADGRKTMGMADLAWLGCPCGSLSDGTSDISQAVSFPYTMLDGINDKGLFIGVLQLKNTATAQERGRTPITTAVAIRAVLDKASTVEEAAALFDAYDMHSPMEERDFHFFVADRSGHSAVLEYCCNELHVLETSHVTNYYLTPEMEQKGGGKDRDAIIKTVLDYRADVLEKNEVMNVLELVSQPSPNGKSKSQTLWSAVYDLTEGTAQIVTNRRYREPQQFSL